MAEISVPFARVRPLSQIRDRYLLGGLVALVTGLDVLWRTIETRPPHWDMARHLGDSLATLHAFSLAHPLRFLELYLYYPPGVAWVADVFYAVTGNQAIWIAVLSNVVFVAVLVYSTYGIGVHLWDRRVGLLAAFFVVTEPVLVSAFKEYMLDAPLTAVVALSMYLLLRSDGFARRRYAAALGLVCGYGMLVKWSFVLAVALPVAAAVGGAALDSIRTRTRARVVNVLLAGGLAFLVCGLWYVHNFSALRADTARFDTRASHIEGDPPIASLSSAFWYLWNLEHQLYLVPLVFLVAGLVYCFRREEVAARNFYPLLWFVGDYILFTLLRNKDARYTQPFLPAVAILATSWLTLVPTRVRRALAGLLVVYGTIAFVAISFGTSLLPKDLSVGIGPNRIVSPTVDPEFVFFAQRGYIIGPPSSEHWHQEDVFRLIARAPRSERAFWFEGGDSIWFNTWGTAYYAARYGASWVGLDAADFVIVRGPPSTPVPPVFHEVGYFRLPTGESLILYQRPSA